MPETSFNRTNDAFIKVILAKEGNKQFLIDLLNSIFENRPTPCIKGPITDVTLEDRVLPIAKFDDGQAILDIRAHTEHGIINIEIQNYKEPDIGARALFYAATLYLSQSTKVIAYRDFIPVVIINLMTENYFAYKSYHSWYSLAEQEEKHLLTDKMFLHFIELKKCPGLEEKTLNRLQKWIKYLSAKTPAGEVQTEGDEIFEQLRRIEQMFVKDREEMLRYEAAERFRLDYNSAIKGATEEGMEKGKDEEKKNIARKMLQLGKPIAEIKMLTDLSESEIEALKN